MLSKSFEFRFGLCPLPVPSRIKSLVDVVYTSILFSVLIDLIVLPIYFNPKFKKINQFDNLFFELLISKNNKFDTILVNISKITILVHLK